MLGQVPELLAGQLRGDGAVGLCRSAGWYDAVPTMSISRTPGADGDDVGVDVDDGVGAALRRLLFQALQGQVPGVVVHVGELLDLAAGEAAQAAEDAAADAQGVGDVADDEVPRLIAGVDLAVEVLAGAGGGEERAVGSCCP